MTGPHAAPPPQTLHRGRLRLSLWITLALVGLNLVAFNALLAGWTGMRLDLTQEGIYSITPATKRILAGLDEDVLIHGYFSKRTHPKLAPLIPRIEDLLAEYEAMSRGRVKVTFLDPKEDELAEEEANDRFGVESTPFRLASKYESGIVNAYFALVVQRGDQYVRYGFGDLIDVEMLPDGDLDVKLRNLEYDLTRAIKKVVYGFRSTSELFEQVPGPVRLVAVMTPGALPELLSGIPDAIRTAAAELETRGGDTFEFVEIDPSTDEAQAREVALRYGARPMSLGLFSSESFYLYGFLEVGESMEQLNLVGEGVTAATLREAVENALRRQAPGFLKTVGVVAPGSDLPPEIMAQLQMQGRSVPPPEFQQVREYLGRDYQVRSVDLAAEDGVPTDVDVLVVIKPRDLDERSVYSLDQYLMRGGRVILCAAPYEPQFSGSELRVMPARTGLEDWLAHFGVTIQDTLVLDDRNQPLPIPEVRRTLLGNIRTLVLKPYPYLVEVRDEGLVNRQITARLEAVGIYWGSPLQVEPPADSGLEVIPILRSSERSWTSQDLTQVQFADYTVPEGETEPQLLAAALSGRVRSYFAEKGAPTGDADLASSEEGAADPPRAEVPLKLSPETRLVVVGDTAFLSDFVARVLAGIQGGFFAENLAFMQNVIDWSTLDNDLVGIRARGLAARRIERLERSTEITLEVINYLVPVLLLGLLAAYRMWLRRNAAPVVVPAAASPPGAGAPARRARA